MAIGGDFTQRLARIPRDPKLRIYAGGALALLVVLLIAIARCGPEAKEAVTPEAPDDPAPSGPPEVRFLGRFDRTDVAGPRFAWSGSALHARFRGTQASITLNDSGPNTYTVIIDKQAPRKFASHPEERVHVLASGLPPGEHDVTVFKNTEAFVGHAQFLGFDFGPAGTLLAPRVRTRHIEAVGDSITTGYGSEGANEKCAFSPDTENAYLAYGPIAARALGADIMMIAWSGKGVIRNGDGSKTGTMPELYSRALPQFAWSQWDASQWMSDAIVINLGTNDFFHGDPGESEFVTAYRSFVETLRKRAPAAQILCAVGPMLTDETEVHSLTRARRYVQSVVQGLRSAGDLRVEYLEFETQDAKRDGLGCDWHPNLKTHRRMAQTLVIAIKKALGW